MRTFNKKGFTIIELLIVIVVIGILATLVLNTFTGVQARARDTERRADLNALSTQLEVYFTDNGGYPDGDVIPLDGTTLPGIDPEVLIDPNNLASLDAASTDPMHANVAQVGTATALSTDGSDATATGANGGAYNYEGVNCGSNNQCESFQLWTYLEDGDELYEETALNN